MKVIAVVGLCALLCLGTGASAVVLLAAAVGASQKNTADGAAFSDIPPNLLPVYQAAASTCPLPFELLAAVGRVETDHGRSTMPGVSSGTNSAGAEGPMQFLPDTWSRYGIDGDGDGRADVYSPVDAIFGAANYLCANGATNPSLVRSALWHYNQSDQYVDQVLSVAATYRIGPYSLPVDIGTVAPGGLEKPHHDYPAIDIPIPVGTPVLAVRGGTAHRVSDDRCGWGVLIDGNDHDTYVYCHSSKLLIADNSLVATGQQIMLSGGQPGAPGAGDSTGPHLHLGISVDGTAVCPQTLLVAWSKGQYVTPSSAPRTGCTTSDGGD